jgi:hypothetical protein
MPRPAAGGVDDPPRGPLELWVADAATGKARKLLGGLNTVFDECALLCLTAVAAEATRDRTLWQRRHGHDDRPAS